MFYWMRDRLRGSKWGGLEVGIASDETANRASAGYAIADVSGGGSGGSR